MSDLVHSVQAWLISAYDVRVRQDWIAACIEWHAQNDNRQMTTEELRMNVLAQWLESDLRELEDGSLPLDIAAQALTYLTGTFCLQVNSMLDIGLPLYGQMQKIQGTVNANSEVSADKPQQPAWEPKPSRVMLLNMTDGQTEVKGMEYKPLPTLTSDLRPGFKMVVHGPVMCRHGILMLTSENIRVLGGLVESLEETNTPAAVLQEAMHKNALEMGRNEKKEFSGRFISRTEKKAQPSTQNLMAFHGNQVPFAQQRSEDKNWKQVKKEETSVSVKKPSSERGSLKNEWDEALEDRDMWDDLEELAVDEMQWDLPSTSTAAFHPTRQTSPTFESSCKQRSDSSKPKASRGTSLSFSSNFSDDLNQEYSSKSTSKCIGKQQMKGVQKNSHIERESVSSQISVWINDFEDELDGGNIEKQRKGSLKSKVHPGNSCAKKDSVSSQISAWINDFDDDFDLADNSVMSCSSLQSEQACGLSGEATGTILSTIGPRNIFRVPTSCKDSGQNEERNENKHLVGEGDCILSSKADVLQQKHSSFNPSPICAAVNETKALLNLDMKVEEGSSHCKENGRPFQGEGIKQKKTRVSANSEVLSFNETQPAKKQSKLTSMLPRVSNSGDDLPEHAAEGTCFSSDGVKLQTEDCGSLARFLTNERKQCDMKDNSTEDASVVRMSSVPHGKQESGTRVAEVLSDGAAAKLPETCVPTSTLVESDPKKSSKDTGMEYNPRTKCLPDTSSKNGVPKAVIPPFAVYENDPVEPNNTPCYKLAEVKDWLEKNPRETVLFTVKGHIATLTSKRLNSGGGKAWSLTCRITDGTAAIEVALADCVLRPLIGFSAEECHKLLRMVKKDPLAKQKQEQGLQACQRALIEFSGLMDLQQSAGDDKPTVVRMKQLAKMQR